MQELKFITNRFKNVILNIILTYKKSKKMNNINILMVTVLISLFIATTVIVFILENRFNKINSIFKNQQLILKRIYQEIKTKTKSDAIIENSELFYQNLLQNLIPLMASIDVMPRESSEEHPLWRSLGAIMDNYAQNPFTLEKIRRAIKLDSNVAQNIETYIEHTNKFLQELEELKKDGILAISLKDGLLGKSLILFEQARQLAQEN